MFVVRICFGTRIIWIYVDAMVRNSKSMLLIQLLSYMLLCNVVRYSNNIDSYEDCYEKKPTPECLTSVS